MDFKSEIDLFGLVSSSLFQKISYVVVNHDTLFLLLSLILLLIIYSLLFYAAVCIALEIRLSMLFCCLTLLEMKVGNSLMTNTMLFP